ncbi:peptidyl-prolyl cis-trans isomerase FKBP17-2, chloroplastic [Neltuma alba]|uniref:peptidyl-prolyl cis-trans isomerase FKBP17-2, chloroplastic n=1 Tax=Neltuma alba TaxID=207710 RepID=UPI0010A2D1A0|nr:peptidyl-prolyl cis-trans isomerase FKBP17-2, chloroplastic [Prosopis alba]
MASFFVSPPIFSLPTTRTHHISSSSATPPPPPSSSPDPQPQKSASQLSTESPEESVPGSLKAQQQKPIKPVASSSSSSSSFTSGTKADSTDWVATSLTRRFGLGAGLAWVAFLAVGVVSEQIKTRLEVSQQEANTRTVEKEEEVVLPNGIRYYELKVGGGATPRTGDLVVIDIEGKVRESGQVFVETFGKEKKPLALVMGSRPYSKGLCEGVETVIKSMKAGGKRRVIVPPSLGFGDDGADLGNGVQIPAQATLEYVVEVERVSIAPA